MKLNRQLSLVQPIQTDAGQVYLHSMPISRAVWEAYFMVLSKTYSTIFNEGIGVLSGPSVAKLILQRIAMQDGVWEGDQGVRDGLLGEMRRLSNVVMPVQGKWTAVPLDQVLQGDLIDEDSLAEAEGALVFFICGSAVLRGPSRQRHLTAFLSALTSLWGRQTSSLDSTEFAASLQTSTPDAPSTEKKAAPDTDTKGREGSPLPY